jgi:hypothetical protein
MAKGPTKNSETRSKARDDVHVEKRLKGSHAKGAPYLEASRSSSERVLKSRGGDVSAPVARGPRVKINDPVPAPVEDREATFDEAMRAILIVMDENDELMRRLA